MQELKERNTTIDLVKTVGVIGVIFIHVVSRIFGANPVGSFEWNVGLFWESIFRASVPLFLMASGAIMIDSSKELSLKKLYLHNIARIIVAMIVWGFAYKIYHLITTSQFTLNNVWYSFKRLLLFDQEFHFYYIHIILIVYAFLPITRIFVKNSGEKELRYALGLWFALAIALPTLKVFWPFNLLSGLTGQWFINMTYASIGYGILGYYLKKYPLSLKYGILFTVVGFSAVFAGTYFSSRSSGYLNEHFMEGMSLGVCAMAVGIYTLVSHIKLCGVLQRVVTFVSKGSFCIYLSHIFVLYEFDMLGVSATGFTAIVSVPLISFAILAICIVLYLILSKIPVLKNWIV